MDIFGIDATVAGLKRGAEKFGGKVAIAAVKKMASRVNSAIMTRSQLKKAANGFAPKEAEPYGAEQEAVENTDSASLGYQSAQKTTTANPGKEALSKCQACGYESPNEWSGKCEGCGVENAEDVGGSAVITKDDVVKENGAGGPCESCDAKVFTSKVNIEQLDGSLMEMDLCTKCCDQAKRDGVFDSIAGSKKNSTPICTCDAGNEEKNPSEHDGRCPVYTSTFEKKNLKNAGQPRADYKGYKMFAGTSSTNDIAPYWAEKNGEVVFEGMDIASVKEQIDKKKNSKENAGHLSSENWLSASLEEKAGWLLAASQDAELARLVWADLSIDVQVALQDAWDMPSSVNNTFGEQGLAAAKADQQHDMGELVDPLLNSMDARDWDATSPADREFDLKQAGHPTSLAKMGWDELSKEVRDAIAAQYDYSNASGKPDQKKFTFKDQQGERHSVSAVDEAAAWQKLSSDFATSVEDVKGMGIKLESTKENASDGKCPGCKGIMSKVEDGGDRYHWWCDTCGISEKPIKENAGDNPMKVSCEACGRTPKDDSDLLQCESCDSVLCQKHLKKVHGDYLCERCADDVKQNSLTNDSKGDLTEIAHHAEGIEHEVAELLSEDASLLNSLGSGVGRGSSKYGTRKNYETEDQKDELLEQVRMSCGKSNGIGQDQAKRAARTILQDAQGDLKKWITSNVGNEFDLQHWIENL